MMRLRFAPSPTGLLHLGGLRTALFNYLWAKSNKGALILRIEDTDQTRFVPGAQEDIISCLEWAGIKFDEGSHIGGKYGPYIQSQRMDIYKKHANILLEKKSAYRCFCDSERLEHVRTDMKKKGFTTNYDRRCLHLEEEEINQKLEANIPYTLRLKVPPGSTKFEDLIHGTITIQNTSIDDQILLKSDSLPTYHLANVVDDHLMDITHVMRGEEWISSTPKHILLYKFFGWEPPKFAHLPLLLNEDKSKLSKRHGSTDVRSYINSGYLPDALVNFIAFLGWNPKTEKEIFTLPELIQEFSIRSVNKANSIVMREKLNWFNKQHIERICQTPEIENLIKDLRLQVQNLDQTKILGNHVFEDSYLKKVLLLTKERITLLNHVCSLFSYFFIENEVDSQIKEKILNQLKPEFCEFVRQSLEDLFQLVPEEEWNEKVISEVMQALSNKEFHGKKQKFKDFMLATRFLLTKHDVGASLVGTIVILSKNVCLKRLSEMKTIIQK